MGRSQRNDNFIDKTFTIVADILLQIIPTTQREKEAFTFLNNLKLMKLAVSLGSTESLAEHPATMTHSDVSADDRALLGISEKLVRISVGVEHYSDIIWDIQQALEKV